MEEIKIVEYERKYAAALAEMWNKSADGWGGEDTVETAATVAHNIETSSNLKTWLALADREVVGFCSFSEYREDQGASYIPLLNVRPDYHGKKVGKRLVLKAVAAACQHPWPRLDLYTWPGNTKAMPLYKKCGFFWEDRDDSTHLMNFIPYVLKTEAAADYFQDADWYGDSQRQILVAPDGRKENGFDFYEYTWVHGPRRLRMEFERRGRGLRLMETEDWLIAASLPRQSLAFGRDYSVSFRLVNKSGKPLQVSFQGKDDQNIRFPFARTVSVVGEQSIAAEFHVGEIKEEQSIWRTHPAVTAVLTINGKKALFKLGVIPKFPARLQVVVPEQEYFPGTEGEFYLNLENGYDETAEFTFSLPENDFITLGQKDFALRLLPQERTTVPVCYSLLKPGLFQGQVNILARPEKGAPVEFSQDATALFAGEGGCFGGENQEHYFAVNGRYIALWRKQTNSIIVRTVEKDYYSTYFTRPELGKPYSVEFAKTKPVSVEWTEENGASCLRGVYRSIDKPGIVIQRIARLKADGLFSQEWQVTNEGPAPVADLWFITRVDEDNAWPVLPLKGRVIGAQDRHSYLGSYNIGDLSENWVYSLTGNRGLYWPKGMTVTGNDWLVLEQELGTLMPGATAAVKPFYFARNTFSNWQDFRRFATEGEQGAEAAVDSLEVGVNGGNPFVKGAYQLTVTQHQSRDFHGKICVDRASDGAVLGKVEADNQSASLTLPALGAGVGAALDVTIETPGADYLKEAVAFGWGGHVQEIREERQGLEVLTVDNGVLSFSLCLDYGPWVFSLKRQGVEWLDSFFPEPGPKSWWNPWLGGIGTEIYEFTGKSLLAQPRSAKFITLSDNKGNSWQGLQTEVTIREHEKYQGLVIRQQVLTLPGLAGVSVHRELENSGHAHNGISIGGVAYFKPGGSEGWVQYQSPRAGQRVCLKQGGEAEFPDVNKLLVGAAGCQEPLMIYCAENLSGYINKEVIQCGSWRPKNLLPGKTLSTSPQFLLFGAQSASPAALDSLSRLRWQR